MGSGGVGVAGLVGRRREVEALLAALESARSGRGGLVAVAGEAGIGKSRLVEAFTQVAADQGVPVAWGRTWEAGGAVPLWPWIQVFRALDLPWPEVDESDDYARFALHDAAASTLLRTHGPAVVVLEDLHAADLATVELLAFVADGLPRSPVLVVATWRTAEPSTRSEIAAALTRARAAVHLQLPGLSTSELGAVVAAELGGSVDERLVAELHEVTGGNPLFAKELARLRQSGGGRVPDSVRAVARQRLDRLEPAIRHVCAVAAVIGREFDLALLAEATSLPRERLLDVLSDAAAAGLLEPAGPAAFRFQHALLRDAVAEALDPASLAGHHLAVAQAMDRLDGVPAAARARQWLGAVPLTGPDPAVHWSAAAASEAAATFAFEEAAEHLGRALDVLGEGAPGEKRLPLLLDRGEALLRCGRSQQAEQVLRSAVGPARAAGDAEALARVAVAMGATDGLGPFGMYAESDPMRLELLREALDGHQLEGAMGVALQSRLVLELWLVPDSDDRRAQLADENLALAERVGDPRALIAAHFVRLMATRLLPDEIDGAIAELTRLTEVTGDVVAKAMAHNQQLTGALARSDMAGARVAAHHLGVLADRYRIPWERWRAACARATMLLLSDRLEEAAPAIDEAHALGQAEGITANIDLIWALQQGMLWRRRGQPQDLELIAIYMADSARSQRVTQFTATAPYATWWHGDRALGMEVLAQAWSQLDRLPRDSMWVSSVAALLEGSALWAQTEGLDALAEELRPWSGRTMVVATGHDVIGPIDRSLGIAEAALGRWDAAEQLLRKAEELDTVTGHRMSLILGLVEWAYAIVIYDGPGGISRAAGLIDRAKDLAGRAGLPAWIQLADSILERAGGETAAAAPPAPIDAPRVLESEATTCTGTLRLGGDVWHVVFDGRSSLVRTSRGMEHLARLLRHPGTEIHVLDLIGAGAEERDMGPGLDDRARREYLARAEQLRDELADAQADDDRRRIEQIGDELEFIASELSSAVGLSGRSRPSGSTAEKARVAVTKAVRSAIKRVAEVDPVLGGHLASAVQTGTWCAYVPDPTAAVTWQVEEAAGV